MSEYNHLQLFNLRLFYNLFIHCIVILFRLWGDINQDKGDINHSKGDLNKEYG